MKTGVRPIWQKDRFGLGFGSIENIQTEGNLIAEIGSKLI